MNDHINQWITAFCDNIHYLRKTHSLTQKQMAQIMGTSVYSVRLLEQGIMPKQLPYTVFYPLCDYFNLSADAFFVPME